MEEDDDGVDLLCVCGGGEVVVWGGGGAWETMRMEGKRAELASVANPISLSRGSWRNNGPDADGRLVVVGVEENPLVSFWSAISDRRCAAYSPSTTAFSTRSCCIADHNCA